MPDMTHVAVELTGAESYYLQGALNAAGLPLGVVTRGQVVTGYAETLQPLLDDAANWTVDAENAWLA